MALHFGDEPRHALRIQERPRRLGLGVVSRFGLELLAGFGGLDGTARAPGSTKDVVLQFEKPAR